MNATQLQRKMALLARNAAESLRELNLLLDDSDTLRAVDPNGFEEGKYWIHEELFDVALNLQAFADTVEE